MLNRNGSFTRWNPATGANDPTGPPLLCCTATPLTHVSWQAVAAWFHLVAADLRAYPGSQPQACDGDLDYRTVEGIEEAAPSESKTSEQFVADSPLEETGFEPSVPPVKELVSPAGTWMSPSSRRAHYI